MQNSLEQLNRSALKFLVPLTPQATYKTIVKEAIKLVNAHYGSLTLEEAGEFNDVYSTLPFRVKRRGRGFTYKAFKEAKAFVVHVRKSKQFRKVHPEFSQTNIRSIILIPLSYRGKSIGVLIVNSEREEHFTKKELDILKLFGSFATLAVRKTQLYDETIQALDARDLFIAMAAHEFRTPLTTISGYTQLLLSKSKIEDDQISRWMQELSWEVVRLTRLVNELLEVNRIKTMRFQYQWEECRFRDIIERAMKNFQFRYPRRTLILQDKLGGESDTVIADPTKLLQALDNVLDNAAKFSRPSKEITVALHVTSKDVVVEAIDKGRGFSKNDLDKIFEGFYKSDEYVEGMGLGLLITKHIITSHKGSIDVYSELNRGTKVVIKIPKAKT